MSRRLTYGAGIREFAGFVDAGPNALRTRLLGAPDGGAQSISQLHGLSRVFDFQLLTLTTHLELIGRNVSVTDRGRCTND